MTSAPRFLGLGVGLGLAAGLIAGVSIAGPGRAADPMPSATPNVPSIGAPAGAPATVPTTVTIDTPPVAGSGTGVARSGAAIAYPYFGGTPGVAPDHTIVVTGFAQSDLNAGGSDRAAAQKRALDGAIADAKGQADVIAAATGLTITGVLSVSASVGPDYGILPMTGATTPSGTGGMTLPQVAPEQPVLQTLTVSVTVAYSTN